MKAALFILLFHLSIRSRNFNYEVSQFGLPDQCIHGSISEISLTWLFNFLFTQYENHDQNDDDPENELKWFLHSPECMRHAPLWIFVSFGFVNALL